MHAVLLVLDLLRGRLRRLLVLCHFCATNSWLSSSATRSAAVLLAARTRARACKRHETLTSDSQGLHMTSMRFMRCHEMRTHLQQHQVLGFCIRSLHGQGFAECQDGTSSRPPSSLDLGGCYDSYDHSAKLSRSVKQCSLNQK